MSEKRCRKKRGRVLDFIDAGGQQASTPLHPVLWLCLILAVISMLCSAAGVSVVNPTTGDTVTSNSLISKDGFVWLLENLLTNFQTFTPLGLVLAMQIAIGFAEKVGLLTTAMRRAILGVPLWCLTATVLFLGINGSIASEASIIVVPALAAAAFESVGMHPVAGLLAGYAATNAGFTACIIVAGTDVLLSGVTESAAQLIDPSMTVNATCNWYFMFVSVFTLTVAATDEASSASRQSWSWQVAARAPRSLTRSLDLSGKAGTLTLTAYAYEGEYRQYPLHYTLQTVYANVPRPLDFSPVRWLGLFALPGAAFALRPASVFWREAYLEHTARYRPAAAVVAAALAALAFLAPLCRPLQRRGWRPLFYNTADWDGESRITFYQTHQRLGPSDYRRPVWRVAHSLLNGRLDLEKDPPAALLALENPYDTAARQEAAPRRPVGCGLL